MDVKGKDLYGDLETDTDLAMIGRVTLSRAGHYWVLSIWVISFELLE